MRECFCALHTRDQRDDDDDDVDDVDDDDQTHPPPLTSNDHVVTRLHEGMSLC